MVRRRLALLAAAAVASLAAVAPVALADWNGKTTPDDPGYAAAESDPVGHCVNDEDWFLFSFIPKCTPLAHDPENAAGMSVDQAWRQFSFGRTDVRMAYVEGGVNWQLNGDLRKELANQAYINQGELPLPERADGSVCSTYDCDGDGDFDVEEYRNDPRLHRPYINANELTPEDLIAAFGHCQIVRGLIKQCPPGGRFDNDHDGYPNDVSGWNFQYGTNDPTTADTTYNHSDDQMRRFGAEGNNGVADVGVCPGCTVIPIKAGDEALDRTDRIAQAIYFAVANGAKVITLLDAELGYSDFTRAALDWAWRKGVVVVGASNDFDSSDHQNGAYWPRVWPGNGLVPNQVYSPVGDTSHAVTSYRSRSNYTSFGPHSLFSTPNSGGTTSESTPTQAGVAALVAAEGLDAADRHEISGPLSAGEIKQVVRETASNIDDPGLGWPGEPGATFNEQYGYGRPNLLKADQAVAANRIPPVPDILAPDWYALFDPYRDSRVPIVADIAAPRARRLDWVVQYGLGPQPTEAQFHTIARGSVSGGHTRGTLATLDLHQIPQSFWAAPFRSTLDISSTEQYDVTIRIQATDERGNMGEDRRAIAVFHDPTLRPGFPLNLHTGAPFAPPELADLQGTGKLDIVFGDANGLIHAIDPDSGRELPGWPAHTAPLQTGLEHTAAWRARAVPRRVYEPVLAPVAIGDLSGNGTLDVVVNSTNGRVYVFDRFGRLRRGFPRTLNAGVPAPSVPPAFAARTRPPSQGAITPPVLAPLPGITGKLAILQDGWDGYLYAIDAAGRDVPGWPVNAQLPAADRPKSPYLDVHDYKLVATPTLVDLNGDGRFEIVLKSQESGQNEQLLGDLGALSHTYELAFWPDGNAHPGGPWVPGFPAQMNALFDYYESAQDVLTEGLDSASAAPSPAGGGDLLFQTPGFLSPILQLGSEGQTLQTLAPISGPTPPIVPTDAGVGNRVPTTSTDKAPVGFSQTGTIAHFGGHLAYLAAGPDLTSLQSLLQAGIAQRITNFMRAYDATTGAPLPGFPAPMMGLPFLTAPAVADVAGGGQADVLNNSDTNNVAAFDAAGDAVAGWPKFTGGFTAGTPAVGDLDASGHNDVVDVTREGYLFVWSTPGDAAVNEAWNWHQDDWHTGRYGTDTRPPLPPRDLRRTSAGRVCWTAPGDDWGVGTAAAYDLRSFGATPSPEHFSRGRRLAAPAPAPAGTRQCADVPRHARFVAIRATDHAGLIGYPAVSGNAKPKRRRAHARRRRSGARHRRRP